MAPRWRVAPRADHIVCKPRQGVFESSLTRRGGIQEDPTMLKVLPIASDEYFNSMPQANS